VTFCWKLKATAISAVIVTRTGGTADTTKTQEIKPKKIFQLFDLSMCFFFICVLYVKIKY